MYMHAAAVPPSRMSVGYPVYLTVSSLSLSLFNQSNHTRMDAATPPGDRRQTKEPRHVHRIMMMRAPASGGSLAPLLCFVRPLPLFSPPNAVQPPACSNPTTDTKAALPQTPARLRNKKTHKTKRKNTIPTYLYTRPPPRFLHSMHVCIHSQTSVRTDQAPKRP